MNKIDVLERLRQFEPALRVRGVRHAALFGSVARGDERATSDIDILIEIDPAANKTAFDYAGLKGRARELAAAPYMPRSTTLPAGIADLTWDQHQGIRFKDDHALWKDDKLRFVAKFFQSSSTTAPLAASEGRPVKVESGSAPA